MKYGLILWIIDLNNLLSRGIFINKSSKNDDLILIYLLAEGKMSGNIVFMVIKFLNLRQPEISGNIINLDSGINFPLIFDSTENVNHFSSISLFEYTCASTQSDVYHFRHILPLIFQYIISLTRISSYSI
jgi:hypothetical protein